MMFWLLGSPGRHHDLRSSAAHRRSGGGGGHRADRASRLSLRDGQENANIDAGLGFIWRISDSIIPGDACFAYLNKIWASPFEYFNREQL
jgi:hypothetical protein